MLRRHASIIICCLRTRQIPRRRFPLPELHKLKDRESQQRNQEQPNEEKDRALVLNPKRKHVELLLDWWLRFGGAGHKGGKGFRQSAGAQVFRRRGIGPGTVRFFNTDRRSTTG